MDGSSQVVEDVAKRAINLLGEEEKRCVYAWIKDRVEVLVAEQRKTEDYLERFLYTTICALAGTAICGVLIVMNGCNENARHAWENRAHALERKIAVYEEVCLVKPPKEEEQP